MQRIPMVNLHRQYLSLKAEIDEAIQSVLDGCDFVMGEAVSEFESRLSEYLGAKFAVGCASGTDALQIALMALGVGPGDEVITSPFTFVATAETIVLLGASPVYVDIDPRTWNIDANLIADRITPRTKVIIPVHLFGQPAEMAPILSLARENGLRVIEDSAQAIGARYEDQAAGTLGDIGALSFYPSKNLGAYGDAGAIVSNSPELAEKCRMISLHGSKTQYHHEVLGVNSRLDSLQAAILRVKLKHLEGWTRARIRVAHRYDEGLQGLDLVLPYHAPHSRHVYYQYSIRSSRRDALADFLTHKGIAHAIYYPVPLHLQPAYRPFAESGIRFPVAEKVAKEIISLPMFPELEDSEIEIITSALTEFCRQSSG
jgi:dTDP-4-amino-4,6-dideoxygalactose transaminase